MKLKKALLIVDVQNDFCPQGALAVKDGDKIIPVINKYVQAFSRAKLPIFCSRDWHPNKTKHFKQFGGVWPKHCVQGSAGAQFHDKLKLTKETIIIFKGMDPEKDSYSAFQALDNNGTDLYHLLKMFGVKSIYICGLATDYCVKYSTLDALKQGFKVKILIDAIKGVNIKPQDSDEAIKEISSWGAEKVSFDKLDISKR